MTQTLQHAAEKRLRVLMITEGTYPFHWGGVSTWCHLLLRDLSMIDFELLSLAASPDLEVQFPLPGNVQAFHHVPLWGIREVLENQRDLSLVELYRRKRSTTEQVVEQHFVPLFRVFVQELFVKTLPIKQLGSVIHALYRFFLRYDFDTAMRSPAVWRCFTTVAQTAFPHLANQAGYPTASFHLADMATALQWLYHWLFPIGRPLPKVDIAHAAMVGICTLVAVVEKFEHGAAMMLTEHGIYLRERYLAEAVTDNSLFLKIFSLCFARRMTELTYALADQISPCCDANHRWELRNGAKRGQIRTIYYGVDSSIFTPEPKPFGDPPVVVWVGRIDPLKDLLTLIRAAGVVHQTRPDIEFRLFGSTPAGNEAYYEKCLELRKELGLEQTVIFAGFRASTVSAFNEGDVVVLSSISEAFPFVVLEAMLCEKPVVATGVGGVPEQVTGCGFAIEPRNPEAMAEAILKLMGDPELCATLGKAARAKAINEFSVQQSGKAHEEAYQRLTKQRQRIAIQVQKRRRHPHLLQQQIFRIQQALHHAKNASNGNISYRNGQYHHGVHTHNHAGNGHYHNGHTVNGHTVNRYTANGHTVNGHSVNGLSANGDDANRHALRPYPPLIPGQTLAMATVNQFTPDDIRHHNGITNGITGIGSYQERTEALSADTQAFVDNNHATYGNGAENGHSGATLTNGVQAHRQEEHVQAAIATLTAEVAQRDKQPIDALEVTALIESMGVTDDVAVQRYGAANAFVLGETIFAQLKKNLGLSPLLGLRSTPPTTWQEMGRDLLRGPLALMPAVILLLCIFASSAVGQWESNRVLALSAGITASMLLTNAFIQAISRRTSIYLGLGKRLAAGQFLWISTLVVGACLAGVVVLGAIITTKIGFFSQEESLTFTLAFLGLSALWLAAGGLSLVQRSDWLAVAMLAGVLMGVVGDWVTNYFFGWRLIAGLILGYSLTMLLILHALWHGYGDNQSKPQLIVSKKRLRLPSLRPLQSIGSLNTDASTAALRPSMRDLFSWNGLTGDSLAMLPRLRVWWRGYRENQNNKKADKTKKKLRLPSLAYMVHESTPLFVYGFCYMTFILLPHILGWLGALGIDQVRAWAVTSVEVGLTVSMPPIIIANGVAEYTLRRFWRYAPALQTRTPATELHLFQRALVKFYWQYALIYLAMLVIWSMITQILFLIAIDAGWLTAWLGAMDMEQPLFIFHAGLVAYGLVGLGVFSCMFCITLNAPQLALRAVLWGILVTLLVGIPLSNWHYSYSSVAFICGALVFVLVAWRMCHQVLQSADYRFAMAL